MFTLGVFSDSHGNKENLFKAMVLAQKNHGTKGFAYLGDGAGDFLELKKHFPSYLHWQVQGNCDYFHPMISLEKTIVLENQKIFLTHGHRYGVKENRKKLMEETGRREGNMVLYGHTHQEIVVEEEGIWAINPGSIGKALNPTFVIVKIEKDQISPYIVTM